MTTYNWYQLVAMIVSIFVVARIIWKMRHNDIKHIHTRLDKIEELLQTHIQWHVDNH